MKSTEPGALPGLAAIISQAACWPCLVLERLGSGDIIDEAWQDIYFYWPLPMARIKVAFPLCNIFSIIVVRKVRLRFAFLQILNFVAPKIIGQCAKLVLHNIGPGSIGWKGKWRGRGNRQHAADACTEIWSLTCIELLPTLLPEWIMWHRKCPSADRSADKAEMQEFRARPS